MKKGKFRYEKIRPVLGDYWFLHNPRAPGCGFSQGRADWGFMPTAAPEVKGGHKISDKTDIYALGICIYYWVTLGKYPNLEQQSLDDLRKDIPLKWSGWVLALLRMCLQQHPTYRASAEQIFMYLGTLKPNKIDPPAPTLDMSLREKRMAAMKAKTAAAREKAAQEKAAEEK